MLKVLSNYEIIQVNHYLMNLKVFKKIKYEENKEIFEIQ